MNLLPPKEELGQPTPVATVWRRWRAKLAGIVGAVIVSQWAGIALAHLLGL
jgi:hypothetical protein